MRLVHEEINEEQGVREAMLAVGDRDWRCVQLLAPLDPDSTIAKFLDRNGPGVQQVAYRVDDIDAVVRRAARAGPAAALRHARRGTAGRRVNFVHPKDAGGVLVELVEPAQAARSRSALTPGSSDARDGAEPLQRRSRTTVCRSRDRSVTSASPSAHDT